MEKMKKQYYDVFKDLEDYPEATIIEAHSKRGPGKTYGFLWGCLSRGITFLYLKRTQKDIELLALDDFNPLKPINRDHGTEYRMERIYEGINGVYDGDGAVPKGYCLAMSAVHKYKGFDMSQVQIICLDEYIPQLGERINRKEGDLLLDLYMTVNRDREERGEPPLKLILFANATELFCPITETFRLVDDLAEMNATGEEVRYLEDRGILLRWIPYSASANKETAIYKAMAGTKWAEMAFEGKFAYNDNSRIKKVPLKNMVCFADLTYNGKTYYLYHHSTNGLFYMCTSRGQSEDHYDLDIEADVRRFYLQYGIILRNEISDGNMFFSDYSSYNLIFNYSKIFKKL